MTTNSTRIAGAALAALEQHARSIEAVTACMNIGPYRDELVRIAQAMREEAAEGRAAIAEDVERK